MIRLLTGLPYPSGLGEYVLHLCEWSGIPSEIYYWKPLTCSEYRHFPERRRTLFSETAYLAHMKLHERELAPQTHVTWEGFGPLFGRQTKLITVHHVPSSHWFWREQMNHLRTSALYWAVRNGCRKIARLSVLAVVPSETTRLDFIKSFGADEARVITIRHGIDSTFYTKVSQSTARTRLHLPIGSTITLSVGRDDLRKNVKTILRVVNSLQRKNQSHTHVHIGTSQVFMPGRHIRVFERVDPILMPLFYSSADLILAPSFQEGFCRPVLEAGACGTPAVVSDLPIFHEILGPHCKGASPNSTSELVSLVEETLRNKEREGKEIQDWVRLNYSLKEFGIKYHRLYVSELST